MTDAKPVGTYANAETLRAAIDKAMTAHYEPTGIVMHPRDYDFMDATQRIATTPGEGEARRRAQEAVADAFDIPHWLAGVDGAKAPLRVRLRTLRRSLPRRVARVLPGVHWHGSRALDGWMDDRPYEPRAGRWFLHIGNYRLGTAAPEEEW